MISKFETLPNEIFHNIFSYFSWDEILISFWSLNQRINFIIGSVFSIDKIGIIFNEPGLSYKMFSSILLSFIMKSSYLLSKIKYMHIDGNNSVTFDFICQILFPNYDKQQIVFLNLKSLYIKRCFLCKPLLKILSLLIQHQLNQLTLTFNENSYEAFECETESSSTITDTGS